MESEHMKCVGHYQKTKSLNYRNRRERRTLGQSMSQARYLTR